MSVEGEGGEGWVGDVLACVYNTLVRKVILHLFGFFWWVYTFYMISLFDRNHNYSILVEADIL